MVTIFSTVVKVEERRHTWTLVVKATEKQNDKALLVWVDESASSSLIWKKKRKWVNLKLIFLVFTIIFGQYETPPYEHDPHGKSKLILMKISLLEKNNFY